MSDTVTVKAKTRFTTALASGVILHMNPDLEAKAPLKKSFWQEREGILIEDARRMYKRGWIEDFEGVEKIEPNVTGGADTPAGNGETRGDNGVAVTSSIPPLYTSKHVGAGYYEIYGPEGFETEKVHGKANLATRVAELNQIAAGGARVHQHPTAPTGGADTPAGNGEDGDNGNGEEATAIDERTGLDRTPGGDGNPDEAPAA